MTAKYTPINIPIYNPVNASSWKPQWHKPESANSSNIPVDNEYSGYNPEGEDFFNGD